MNKHVRSSRREQVLAVLGLEARRSKRAIVASALGLIGAGALLGAGLTLVLAPGLLLHRAERE